MMLVAVVAYSASVGLFLLAIYTYTVRRDRAIWRSIVETDRAAAEMRAATYQREREQEHAAILRIKKRRQ